MSAFPPWPIVVWLVSAWLLARLWGWFNGQYEATAGTPWRFRFTRRWYGIRSHVRCRDDDGIYQVRDWSDDGTAVPWLLVGNTGEEAGEDVFWAPVTGFTPFAVRRFRPGLLRHGRLFWYETGGPASADPQQPAATATDADGALEDAAVKWVHGGEPSGPAEETVFASFAASERRALEYRDGQERAAEAWCAAGGTAGTPDESTEPF